MKFLSLAAMVLALAACQQDPYGGKKPSDGAPPPKVEKPDPLPGVDSLQITDVMGFSEGKKGEHIIRATVKGNGLPVVVLSGGPTGVTYDKTIQKLVWTPDYAAANDPRDPAILTRNYTIDVSVFSSDDMSTVRMARKVVLSVVDTPKPAAVLSQLDKQGFEGQPLDHVIDFKDEEYPQGPFEIAVVGLPAGALLIWPNRTVPSFTLRWNPGLTEVKGNPQADFTGDITLYNPRGRRLQFSVRWTIKNAPTAPFTTGPTSVIQGAGDLDFMVMAEDLNGEEVPEWKVLRAPPYGIFSVSNQPLTGPGLPRVTGIVTWKAIPRDKLGTIQPVELQACVDFSLCTVYKAQLLPLNTPPNQGGRR